MSEDLFFESIEQAVCIINRPKEGYNGFSDLSIELNSSFRHYFPEIDSSNLFNEFSIDFVSFVVESFESQDSVNNENISFSYRNKTFLILKKQLSSFQYAFLFKEKKNEETDTFISIADTTEIGSKAIETIVEEKSNLLFQLIESLPDIVCVKDGNGNWLMANSANLRLFELENINYYGKTSTELSEFVSFQKDALISFSESDIITWNTKTLYRSDEIIQLPDGGEIILDTIRIPSFNADGTRKMLIVIGRDITIQKNTIENLKRTEKRYSLAQKASGIVSWEWDLEKLNLNWAENLGEVFGSSDIFKNKTFKDVLQYVYPEDRFVFLRKMINSIENLEDYDFEIRIYDIDHNVKWVKLSGLIYYDALKDNSSLLGIVYDITERKNYVKDILEAKTKAEESDQLKSTFLATMSHELRTPLNAVIGFSDIMLGYDLDGDMSEFVKLISTNGIQLLKLIEDIFDLSLIESNQIKIYKSKFDLIHLLQELADIIPIEIRKLYKENDIELIVDLPDNKIILNSDASRIKQIISNLLKNAIKFTPKGLVKLGVQELENDVIIYVEDNGIGISKEKQEIIFEIFRQGEETLSRQFGGAGLGLSISNNLAELLGAQLSVNSELGKGSVFSFIISREKEEYQIIEQKEFNMQTMDWKDKYVLIAEDEYSNYELLVYILKPTKIRIKQVTNGNDAINEVLNIERPDIILMDIKMPDLNGFEATKRIKEVFPDLPIIAQTAFAISGDRELALSMGCDEYISKPINKSHLLDLMIKHLS